MTFDRAVILLLFCLAGCNPGPTPAPAGAASRPEPAGRAAAAPAQGDGKHCLPLVSGCGCAYVCAETFRVREDGTHEVVHDFQDSRLDPATIETWCFDDAGRGEPRSARTRSGNCREIYFDGTACGGECIPSNEFLSCAWRDGRCRSGSFPSARP